MNTPRSLATSLALIVLASAVFGASTRHTHHKKKVAHHKIVASHVKRIPRSIPPISVDGRTKLLRARRAAAAKASQTMKLGQKQTGIPTKFATVDDLHKWADSLRYRDASGAQVQYPWHVNIDSAGGDKQLYVLTVYPYGTTDEGDVAVWESGPTGIVLQAWQNDVNLAMPQEPATSVPLSDTTYVVQQPYGPYQQTWITPYTSIMWGGQYGTGVIYRFGGRPIQLGNGG